MKAFIIIEQLYGRAHKTASLNEWEYDYYFYFYGERVFAWNSIASNSKHSKAKRRAYAFIKLINLNKFTLFDVIKSTLFQFCWRFMCCVCSFLVEFMELYFWLTLAQSTNLRMQPIQSNSWQFVCGSFVYIFWNVLRIEKRRENHITHKLCFL